MVMHLAHVMEVFGLVLLAALLGYFVRIAGRMQRVLVLWHELLLEKQSVLWRVRATESGPHAESRHARAAGLLVRIGEGHVDRSDAFFLRYSSYATSSSFEQWSTAICRGAETEIGRWHTCQVVVILRESAALIHVALRQELVLSVRQSIESTLFVLKLELSEGTAALQSVAAAKHHTHRRVARLQL